MLFKHTLASLVLLSGGGCGDDTSTRSTDSGIDSSADAAVVEPPGFDWEQCGPYRCATVPVPLDYADPGGPTIDIRILRAPATDPTEDIGMITYNGGGPGVPSLRDAARIVPALQGLDPRFEVVLIDPRGTGESTPVDCVDDADLDALRALPFSSDRSDTAAWTQIEAAQTAFGAGCAARTGVEILPHLTSDDVARDIDRIREMLGHERVSFFGVSYAGVLAAAHATLFPDRVRAFAVDSPSISHADVFEWQRAEAAGYEREAQRFFDECGADSTCPFHGGEGAAVGVAFDAMLATTRATPMVVGSRQLHEVDLAVGVAQGLRSGFRRELAQALADAEAGDATGLLERADRFLGRLASGYEPIFEAQVAIRLTDQGCPDLDLTQLQDRIAAAGVESPRFGYAFSAFAGFCLEWPAETIDLSPVSAASAPPLLLVVGAHDPPVPVSNATMLRDELGNGSHVITWEGEGHTSWDDSDCVFGALQSFLRDPTAAPAVTTCAE